MLLTCYPCAVCGQDRCLAATYCGMYPLFLYFLFLCIVFWKGSRLINFDIGLTNVSPTSQPPISGNYSICCHQTGIPPEKQLFMCTSVTRGRYLVVELNGDMDPVTICELEVYTIPCEFQCIHNFISIFLDSKSDKEITNCPALYCGKLSEKAP